MEAETVRDALITVIQTIQTTTCQQDVPVTGGIRPVKDLPGFDSKVWPVAISMLASKLAIVIPPDVNIFANQITKKVLTIDEVAKLLCQLSASQPAKSVAS